MSRTGLIEGKGRSGSGSSSNMTITSAMNSALNSARNSSTNLTTYSTMNSTRNSSTNLTTYSSLVNSNNDSVANSSTDLLTCLTTNSSSSSHFKPSLDKLPDEIILKILEYVDSDYRLFTTNDQPIWFPSSSFLNVLTTCKRFLNLGQDLARSQVFKSFGKEALPFIQELNSDDPVKEIWRRARILKDDSGTQQMLPKNLPKHLLWTTILILLRKSYLFIDQSNVDVNTQEDIWSIERGEDISIKRGPWRVLPPHRVLNPWGNTLHAANVTFLKLQMSSVLLPGRYKIYLSISLESHYRLASLRFSVNESEGITSKFRSFPPVSLNFNKYNGIEDAKLQYEENFVRSTEICVGVIEVTGEARQVTLNIEDVSVSMKRNIGFWFIFYEWFDIEGGNLPAMATPYNLTDWNYSVGEQGWVFPKKSSMWPDKAVGVVHKTLNSLKENLLVN